MSRWVGGGLRALSCSVGEDGGSDGEGRVDGVLRKLFKECRILSRKHFSNFRDR